MYRRKISRFTKVNNLFKRHRWKVKWLGISFKYIIQKPILLSTFLYSIRNKSGWTSVTYSFFSHSFLLEALSWCIWLWSDWIYKTSFLCQSIRHTAHDLSWPIRPIRRDMTEAEPVRQLSRTTQLAYERKWCSFPGGY